MTKRKRMTPPLGRHARLAPSILPFLMLPRELRDKIYNLTLAPYEQENEAILTLNHQVRDEALGVLYDITDFECRMTCLNDLASTESEYSWGPGAGHFRVFMPTRGPKLLEKHMNLVRKVLFHVNIVNGWTIAQPFLSSNHLHELITQVCASLTGVREVQISMPGIHGRPSLILRKQIDLIG